MVTSVSQYNKYNFLTKDESTQIDYKARGNGKVTKMVKFEQKEADFILLFFGRTILFPFGWLFFKLHVNI